MRTLAFEVNGSMREVKILDKNLEVKADHRLKADKKNPGHLDLQFRVQSVESL